jgi:hypothetical protein
MSPDVQGASVMLVAVSRQPHTRSRRQDCPRSPDYPVLNHRADSVRADRHPAPIPGYTLRRRRGNRVVTGVFGWARNGPLRRRTLLMERRAG